MKYALAIIAVMVCLIALPKAQSDTTKLSNEQRTDKFYDSLRAKTHRRGFSRFLMKFLLRNETDNMGLVVDQAAAYRKFTGKIIANISIDRHNIYDDADNWLSRSANNLHVVTREVKIKNDLLFKPGQELDPDVLVKTQQLLRSRGYLYDADIIVTPGVLQGTVDVQVITRDSWTISGDLRISGEKTYIGLYDANILGTGNKLRVNTNLFVGLKRVDYQGNIVELDVANLFGTFFSFESRIGKEFEYSDLELKLSREFILPNDYMLGASYDRPSKPTYIHSEDSMINTKAEFIDFWGGLSRQLPGKKSATYISARYLRTSYMNSPGVSATFNPAFHKSNLILAGTGLYRERFLTTSLIYGYGNREYIPVGYKAELVGGYDDAQFGDSWYVGANYSGGHLFAGGDYALGKIEFGTYITTRGKMHRSALHLSANYYSRLLSGHSLKVRQIVGFDYTQGWNRLDGNTEHLSFYGGMATPRSFRKSIFGTSRAVINTETVLFTPLQPLGFRMAFFAFADFGLLGYDPIVFKNPFFSTFGVGVRIKNERLIFSTVQLTLGLAVGKGGLMKNQLFRFSNQQKINEIRFKPFAPSTVPFY